MDQPAVFFFFVESVLSCLDDGVVVRNSLYFEPQSCCVINLNFSSLGEKSKYKQNYSSSRRAFMILSTKPGSHEILLLF